MIKSMDVHVRPETPADFERINRVVVEAFESAEHTDKDEHHLVKRIRLSSAYEPDLALVAALGGEVVGHILFSRAIIQDEAGKQVLSLALAPVSVHPDFQGMGIGGALIVKGHSAAKAKGYTSVVVLGHPSYYPRFGYEPASKWGIKTSFDVPDEAFMALELVKGSLADSAGIVAYSSAFWV